MPAVDAREQHTSVARKMSCVPSPWWTSQSRMNTRRRPCGRGRGGAATATRLTRQKPDVLSRRAWWPGGRVAQKPTARVACQQGVDPGAARPRPRGRVGPRPPRRRRRPAARPGGPSSPLRSPPSSRARGPRTSACTPSASRGPAAPPGALSPASRAASARSIARMRSARSGASGPCRGRGTPGGRSRRPGVVNVLPGRVLGAERRAAQLGSRACPGPTRATTPPRSRR